MKATMFAIYMAATGNCGVDACSPPVMMETEPSTFNREECESAKRQITAYFNSQGSAPKLYCLPYTFVQDNN